MLILATSYNLYWFSIYSNRASAYYAKNWTSRIAIICNIFSINFLLAGFFENRQLPLVKTTFFYAINLGTFMNLPLGIDTIKTYVVDNYAKMYQDLMLNKP